MEQSYIIGGSIGGSVGLLTLYGCFRLCRIICAGTCIDSRNRIHVDVGGEDSGFKIKGDATINIRIGSPKSLPAETEKIEGGQSTDKGGENPV
jgi:hypothetical protein